MQFDKSKLIAMIDERIKSAAAKGSSDLIERQRAYDKALAAWQINWAPRWTMLANNLLDALDKNEPVRDLGPLSDAIKWNSSDALFKSTRPETVLDTYIHQVARFQRLKAVIEAAKDEVVSETTLLKMGFKLTELVD